MKYLINKFLVLHRQNSLDDIKKLFYDLWSLEPNNAIKIAFFILDKEKGVKNEDLFIILFDIVKELNNETFLKNLSHIVGQSNTRSIPQKVHREIMKPKIDKESEILDKFIQKDHQQTFQQYQEDASREKLFESLDVPCYGSWTTLINIYNKYNEQKIRNYVINIFDKQITLDRSQEKFSRALEVLSRFPDILKQTRYQQTEQYKKKISFQETKSQTFQERYAVITC